MIKQRLAEASSDAAITTQLSCWTSEPMWPQELPCATVPVHRQICPCMSLRGKQGLLVGGGHIFAFPSTPMLSTQHCWGKPRQWALLRQVSSHLPASLCLFWDVRPGQIAPSLWHATCRQNVYITQENQGILQGWTASSNLSLLESHSH